MTHFDYDEGNWNSKLLVWIGSAIKVFLCDLMPRHINFCYICVTSNKLRGELGR